MTMTQPQIRIRTELQPGDVGYIIYLHGVLYAREYGLDHTFEGSVAQRFGEFVARYDERKDLLAIAELDGRIVGSIVIDGQAGERAMLRYFLVHPDARGRGLGHKLIDQALAFCRERGFKTVYLWTITDLKAARHLYEQAGFVVTREETHEIWGAVRTEQEYELNL
ncbi:MAG TPA: GNAT family N-acetyltransferase [Pyrinomonadaceae bacterium]|nr:GNAT family N-acetyltransferase [Pyrinomonadaceae bacterium]